MLANPVARVYAEALFGIAQDRSVVDECLTELKAFAGVVEAHPDVAKFLASPVLEPSVKIEQLKKSLGDRFSDIVTDFLCLLVERRRFHAFAMTVEVFRALADDHAGRVRVEVRAATTISPALQEEIAGVLREKLNRRVEVHAEKDETLLGGAVVTVGDKVYDGSLRTRLRRFRKQLVRS